MKNKKAFKGILYGLIPHMGCILFVIASVLGVTVLVQFFKPILMNRNIFYYLILISLGFVTLSSFLYLRKNKFLSLEGIKKKKNYLFTMYGLTVGINLLLFFFIFPFLANLGNSGIVSALDSGGTPFLEISSKIPCPGHAPLISDELKAVEGVKTVDYSFPNKFKIYYDSSLVSKEKILQLEIFEEFPAEVLDEGITREDVLNQTGG